MVLYTQPHHRPYATHTARTDGTTRDAGVNSPTRPLYRTTQFVWYLFYAAETILVFRFVLKLVGANTTAAFTRFIFNLSAPLMQPFQFVLPAPRISGSIFEWSTLLAMFVYWVAAWGIVRLLLIGKPVSEYEAHRKLSRQDIEDEF